MSNTDDDRMEAYLKQFRPMATEPLPLPARRRLTQQPFVFAAWAFAAAVLVAVALTLFYRARVAAPVSQGMKTSVPAAQNGASPALTLREANEILAHAPSYRSALDGIAFRLEKARPPADMKSALEVLSREDRKL